MDISSLGFVLPIAHESKYKIYFEEVFRNLLLSFFYGVFICLYYYKVKNLIILGGLTNSIKC